MLKDADIMATIAVKDMAAARKFYEGVLGLELTHSEGGMAHEYRSGNSRLLVYQSQFAGTNRATAATWTVDVEAVVGELTAKGVKFEHYDFPGVERKGDIHIGGGLKNAWFKDPDGNILALVGQG